MKLTKKSKTNKSTSTVAPTSWYKAFAQPGILAGTCLNDSSSNLLLIDASTGKTIAQHTVPATMHEPTLGSVNFSLCDGPNSDDGASNLYIRQQFSPDFSKLTFTSAPQSDGSVHVGYLDIATNKFTDLTAQSITMGFSANIPIDVNPIFDPKNGMLCFVRTSATPGLVGSDPANGSNEIHCNNLSTHADVIEGGVINSPSNDVNNYFLTIQNGIFVTGDHLVSPDSNLFTVTAPTVLGRVLFAPTIAGIASFMWDASKPLPNGTYFDVPFNTLSADVFAWLNNSNLLMSFRGSSGIYMIPPSSSHELDATPLDIIPTNNAANTNVIVSPSGTNLAFIHTLLSVSDLFITPTAAGSTPTKLLHNFSARLIEWQ